MLIYRVEHIETGVGPFRQENNILAWIFQDKLQTHPAPYDDGIPNFMDGYDSIGCVSLEQLKFWFQDHIPCLKEMGMVVRVFSANDDFVNIGRTQASFARCTDDIVEELGLDCLA